MSRLETTSAKISSAVGIDGTIVIVAIQAIVNLISVCLSSDPSPAEIARAAKYPRRRHRRAMRNAVYRELDSRGQVEKLDAMMVALQGEIAVMTPDEIAEVCRECSQLTADYN